MSFKRLALPEWLIYLTEDGNRIPAAVFFGDLVKSETKHSESYGFKRSNTSIEAVRLPDIVSDEQLRDKLPILHAKDQTIFKIVPNDRQITTVFRGEEGISYSFDQWGALMVKGRLRIEFGPPKEYDDRHSVYIDGIAVITIGSDRVAITSQRNRLFLDDIELPEEEKTSDDFPERPFRKIKSDSDLLRKRTDRDFERHIEEDSGFGQWTRTPNQTLERTPHLPLHIMRDAFGVSPKASPVSRRSITPAMRREEEETEESYETAVEDLSDENVFDDDNEDDEDDEDVFENWVKQTDASGGYWLVPKRFFDGVYPSLQDPSSPPPPIPPTGIVAPKSRPVIPPPTKPRTPPPRVSPSRATEPIYGPEDSEDIIPPELRERWAQRKDQTGTWFFPKTFFGKPFTSWSGPQESRPKETGPQRPRTLPPIPPRTGKAIPSPTRPRTSVIPRVSPTRVSISRTSSGGVRIIVPQDRQKDDIHEYLIFFTAKPRTKKRAVATLIGRIRSQNVFQSTEQNRSNGSIGTVLIDLNNAHSLRTAAEVRHSPNLVVVSVEANAVVTLYGEISGGFSFGSDSVLQMSGHLFISRNGVEEQPISGITSLTVTNGRLSLVIRDNNEMVLLDEGMNNYYISRVTDESSLADRSGSTSRLDPFQQISPNASSAFDNSKPSPIDRSRSPSRSVRPFGLDLSPIDQTSIGSANDSPYVSPVASRNAFQSTPNASSAFDTNPFRSPSDSRRPNLFDRSGFPLNSSGGQSGNTSQSSQNTKSSSLRRKSS